jgi:hypothetical protein
VCLYFLFLIHCFVHSPPFLWAVVLFFFARMSRAQFEWSLLASSCFLLSMVDF